MGVIAFFDAVHQTCLPQDFQVLGHRGFGQAAFYRQCADSVAPAGHQLQQLISSGLSQGLQDFFIHISFPPFCKKVRNRIPPGSARGTVLLHQNIIPDEINLTSTILVNSELDK